MKLTEAIAQHFYEVHYGNSWTDVAMKEVLEGVSWQQATTHVNGTNTIAMLVYHMNFYNEVVSERLQGVKRSASHESSFEPEVDSEEEWQDLKKLYFTNVDRIHQQILGLDESKMFEPIPHSENTMYKSLHGLVEHIHYHLGQIVILKKITPSV